MARLPASPARRYCLEDGAGRMEILMTVSKFASICTMVGAAAARPGRRVPAFEAPPAGLLLSERRAAGPSGRGKGVLDAAGGAETDRDSELGTGNSGSGDRGFGNCGWVLGPGDSGTGVGIRAADWFRDLGIRGGDWGLGAGTGDFKLGTGNRTKGWGLGPRTADCR